MSVAFRIALLLWLGALSGNAAIASGAATADVDRPGRFERSVLWRVDSPGKAPSYLFGTLHSDDERVLDLSRPVKRAFARAQRLAVELIDDEDAIRRYRSAMVTREPRLPDALGADLYARTEPLLRERGIPREACARFRPWAALIVLLQPRESPGIMLDHVLVLDARRLGKPVEQLETVEEQIETLDGMPEDSQLALLRRVVARQDEIELAVRPLVSAYLQHDLAGMWTANAQAMGDDPASAPHNDLFLQRLLFDRSARFAQRLAPLLRKGGVFAAFGALHLYGEHGVPALLARQGFRVTPLP